MNSRGKERGAAAAAKKPAQRDVNAEQLAYISRGEPPARARLTKNNGTERLNEFTKRRESERAGRGAFISVVIY